MRLVKPLADWVFKVALDDNPNRISKSIADLLFFNKIRGGDGGRAVKSRAGRRCVALDETLCRFFNNIGIPVYQGYGLTETSPVLTANYPGHNTPGTVGPPFPGVQVEIRGPDNEICCKRAQYYVRLP